MFSLEYKAEIEADLARRLRLLEERIRWLEQEAQGTGFAYLCRLRLEEKRREMDAVLETCDEDTAWALRYLWASMPLSDLLDYPSELFRSYGEHGVFLWRKGPFAGKVPERIFADYVLYHRVNDEDLVDNRKFFYHLLAERLPGEDPWRRAAQERKCGEGCGSENGMVRAALEVNYWCAGEAAYQASDERTQNPRTLYGAVTGRCGEESTLTVTALRSVGIPARQVYAPLWSHCDDNHAWVEVWCEGEWHFLGACEPEERLDLGWFNQAASRAMRVRSRKLRAEQNHLARYAPVVMLTVRVTDEAGSLVDGARVDFQVLNQGGFGKIVSLWTGAADAARGSGMAQGFGAARDPAERDSGTVRLTTGRGDLLVSASLSPSLRRDGEGALYGERLISLAQVPEGSAAEYGIVLKSVENNRNAENKKMAHRETVVRDQEEFLFHAPPASASASNAQGRLSEEEKGRRERRLMEADRHREAKLPGYVRQWQGSQVLELYEGEQREALEEILWKSAHNFGELLKFLEKAQEIGPDWKLKVLETLSEKDYRDVTEEILEECVSLALPYEKRIPEEIFFPYVACPRVGHEMLRPCRRMLLRSLDPEERDRIRRDPPVLFALADRWIRAVPEEEYGELVTSPSGCLRGGFGSELSKKIFCVTLYRALGIPARLRSLDQRVEYFQNGRFWGADRGEDPEDARLILRGGGSFRLQDWETYSLGRFVGDGYRRLDLREALLEGRSEETLRMELPSGLYRLIASRRLINGDQQAWMRDFFLEKGERKEISLSTGQGTPGTVDPEDAWMRQNADAAWTRREEASDKLSDLEFSALEFSTLEGERRTLAELAGGKEKSLFVWLEVGSEPTEHFLNEICDRREDYEKIAADMYLILCGGKNFCGRKDLKNRTLERTLKLLPDVRPFTGSRESEKFVAESLGREPGSLPLVLLLREGGCRIYAETGYRVGMAELLRRLWDVPLAGNSCKG